MKENIELSRRKILVGLGTIGIASAGAGAGTMALFSDEETSTGNSVQAGTLDLRPNGGDMQSVSFSEVVPGGSDSKSITVQNRGSINGSLDVGIGQVNTNVASPEPQQSFDDVRTMTYSMGRDQNGNGPFALSDFGLGEATLELDVSGLSEGGSGSVDVTVELPKDHANSNDNTALSFDADNDGEVDFQVIYQEGWHYKEVTNGSWGPKTSGTPSSVSNEDKTGTTISFTVDVDDPFAIGGNIRYASENPNTTLSGSYGSNLVIDLTPNFSWATTSEGYVEIERGSLRNLGDMLDLTLSVGGTEIVSGKANRIDESQFDVNQPVGANGGTATMDVGYELGPNVGNAVQGETVSFPIEFELNQEDSQ